MNLHDVMVADIAERTDAPVLIVFARAPVVGQVKTRLAATIGAEAAATAYRELVVTTLRNAAAARRAGHVRAIELWCTPAHDDPYFQTLAARFGVELHRQCQGDLGERMADALAEVLTRSPRALLIGTDCPVLGVPELAAAGAALDTTEAVLAPAADGGFVLVGTRVPLTFRAVRWSGPQTLAETRTSLRRDGVAWTELPVLWDVDELVDLLRWQSALDGDDESTAGD